MKNHSTFCIGHLTPEEIINIAGFQLREKRGETYVPQLRDKVVVDFGAGVSDFATSLLDVSMPKKVVTIDTMYENEELFNDFLQQTQQKIQDLIEALNEEKDSPVKQCKMNIRNRQISLVEKASFRDDSKISRYSGIESLGKNICDYIFMSDVFVSLEDPFQCLVDISRIIKPKGKIIITESQGNIDIDPDAINILTQEARQGYAGIRVLHDSTSTFGIEMTGVYLKEIETNFARRT